MGVGCKPETTAVEEILRLGKGDPWALGRIGGVGHDVVVEGFHVFNRKIFLQLYAT
jgi:hypothetical protein